MRDRYTLIVGLLFAAIIIIAVLNGGGGGGGTLGLDDQPRHWPLPEFAVPLATGDLEGDANVAQDDCESSRLPCPGGDRRTPACRVHLRGSFTVCDLFSKPSVISFFTTGADCVSQQDVVDAAAERYRGRVKFLAVNLGDDRDSVRELIRQRGWSMPVGMDPDGAVGALYRVGVCPTLAYVFPGGTLQDATVGELGPKQLDKNVEGLLRAVRRAEVGEES